MEVIRMAKIPEKGGEVFECGVECRLKKFANRKEPGVATFFLTEYCNRFPWAGTWNEPQKFSKNFIGVGCQG
jgi:hypothetical protein